MYVGLEQCEKHSLVITGTIVFTNMPNNSTHKSDILNLILKLLGEVSLCINNVVNASTDIKLTPMNITHSLWDITQYKHHLLKNIIKRTQHQLHQRTGSRIPYSVKMSEKRNHQLSENMLLRKKWNHIYFPCLIFFLKVFFRSPPTLAYAGRMFIRLTLTPSYFLQRSLLASFTTFMGKKKNVGDDNAFCVHTC